MDVNGLNFWMLSTAADWLPPGGSDTLYYCPDKQRLHLRSVRSGKPPVEDFATASGLVEQTPMTQDAFGNYARWNSTTLDRGCRRRRNRRSRHLHAAGRVRL